MFRGYPMVRAVQITTPPRPGRPRLAAHKWRCGVDLALTLLSAIVLAATGLILIIFVALSSS